MWVKQRTTESRLIAFRINQNVIALQLQNNEFAQS